MSPCTPTFAKGDQVWAHSLRWTPDGWEPLRQLATVIDPWVQDDDVYAGDVEVHIEGELSRCFYSPLSLERADADVRAPS